jgi:hypothetical protein
MIVLLHRIRPLPRAAGGTTDWIGLLNANAGICARPTDRFDGARLQQPLRCIQLGLGLGIDTQPMVFRYQWIPVIRLCPRPVCFQLRHRHRRRSLGQWTNLSSKAHSKVAHRHRRRRSPHKQPRCRRLATSRLDGLSSPLRGPIPYPRVQRLRHHLSIRSQPIRLRIRPPMLQRELPAAASRPTTPGSLW